MGALRRLSRARRDRALGIGRDARRAAAARERVGHPPPGPRRASTATAPDSVAGAEGSGCRNARFASGSTSSSRSDGVRAFCVYRPHEQGQPPPRAACRGWGKRRACRSTGRRSRSCGTSAAIPPMRSIATTTRTTLNGMRPYANGGGPTTADVAARARARARADFVSRVVDRLDGHRDRSGRPGLAVCALDTELLGHWWHEGPPGCRPWWRRPAPGPRAFDPARGAGAPRAACRSDPGVELGRGQGPRHLGLTRGRGPGLAGTTSGASSSCQAVRGEGRVQPARGALERAARELLALQSSDWAFMSTARAGGGLSRSGGCATTRPCSSGRSPPRAPDVKDSRDMSTAGEAAIRRACAGSRRLRLQRCRSHLRPGPHEGRLELALATAAVLAGKAAR